MRAIRITLRTPQPATLPLAYNELVQGLLYSCWRESFPELHDDGFGTSRMFRLFTFSPLTGKSTVSGKAKTIRFYDTISFEVRSPIEELLDELAHQLVEKESIRLGSNEMKLVNLQSCDRLIFPKHAVLRMLSPVVAYKTTDDNHTRYFSPEDQEWLELIQSNVMHKAELFALDCSHDMVAIPKTESLRKHVTRFKGTYVTGWTGDLIVAADPFVMSMLYFTGLGAKNSQGFGMFNMLDESL